MSRCAVCESASVLSTASPSAPPTSREVFSKPDASPLCAARRPAPQRSLRERARGRGRGAEDAAREDVGQVAAAGSHAGEQSETRCARQHPGGEHGRTPTRATSRGAIVEASTMLRVIGRNDRPACSAPSPSTCCM